MNNKAELQQQEGSLRPAVLLPVFCVKYCFPGFL